MINKIIPLNQQGIHVCSGSAGTGKSFFLVHNILNLLENEEIFPTPTKAISELGYLLSCESKIYFLTNNPYELINHPLILNKFKEKFNAYIKLINLNQYNSYHDALIEIQEGFRQRYIFIDGEPSYIKDPLNFSISQKSKDLQKVMKIFHTNKDFVLLIANEIKNISPNHTNQIMNISGGSTLTHSATSIVRTIKANKSKIQIEVVKTRFTPPHLKDLTINLREGNDEL